ncbi:MAG: pyruvate, water dikinase regulatory protein, partial [Bacteroidota bacterium]|nr:pyruvate, water dikinase regulatory protein [Bacteroidota bacterium]
MVEALNNNIDTCIYVFSGGKGLPTHSIVQSILVQYPESNIPVKIFPDIRDKESIDKDIREVWNNGGFIVHSMVDRKMREHLIDRCREFGIIEFDMVGNLFIYLTFLLKQEPMNEPGLFRKMNLEYFDRIEAIEYTIGSDDGLNPKSIHEADIVLTGISRTGKTPTSMYMAMLGWKVANVPLVQGVEPPEDLFLVDPQRVFGLDITTSRLVSHRKKRLSDFGIYDASEYIEPRAIRTELDYANSIFRSGGFTVIKVTNKPIESVANEIIEILSLRFNAQSKRKGDR